MGPSLVACAEAPLPLDLEDGGTQVDAGSPTDAGLLADSGVEDAATEDAGPLEELWAQDLDFGVVLVGEEVQGAIVLENRTPYVLDLRLVPAEVEGGDFTWALPPPLAPGATGDLQLTLMPVNLGELRVDLDVWGHPRGSAVPFQTRVNARATSVLTTLEASPTELVFEASDTAPLAETVVLTNISDLPRSVRIFGDENVEPCAVTTPSTSFCLEVDAPEAPDGSGRWQVDARGTVAVHVGYRPRVRGETRRAELTLQDCADGQDYCLTRLPLTGQFR